MTEDEAKTKWCAHARQVGDPRNMQSSWNRTAGEPWETCIGSACMAWRWDYAGTVIEFDGMITVAQLDRMKRQATPQHGFCGLAGRP